MANRRWYSGLVMIPKIGMRTFSTFQNHKLGSFLPFLVFLLLGSGVMWVINAIAPLAPFVYSLF